MEQAKLYLVLGGLLVLALILASALRRYQEVMAERRMRVRRIMRGVDQLKGMLGRVSGCPLPIELEKLLHQDVLNRLMRIKQIDARYTGIDTLLAEALEEGDRIVESQRFEIQDKLHLQKVAHALDEMMNYLSNGNLLTPLSAEQARDYVQLAAVRRSEAVYRYHLDLANKAGKQGDSRTALMHCNNILTFLKHYGPADSQVKAWYKETEVLKDGLSGAKG